MQEAMPARSWTSWTSSKGTLPSPARMSCDHRERGVVGAQTRSDLQSSTGLSACLPRSYAAHERHMSSHRVALARATVQGVAAIREVRVGPEGAAERFVLWVVERPIARGLAVVAEHALRFGRVVRLGAKGTTLRIVVRVGHVLGRAHMIAGRREVLACRMGHARSGLKERGGAGHCLLLLLLFLSLLLPLPVLCHLLLPCLHRWRPPIRRWAHVAALLQERRVQRPKVRRVAPNLQNGSLVEHQIPVVHSRGSTEGWHVGGDQLRERVGLRQRGRQLHGDDRSPDARPVARHRVAGVAGHR
mmetsp:Transcript_10504/g.33369  ORF Transcript_10504/g.33369 Transcript_10504/m.33369 type:complete len:302 (-) Transcript_10504:264-1169(-)